MQDEWERAAVAGVWTTCTSAPRAVVSTVVGGARGPGRRPSRSAFVTCEYSWWRGASVYLRASGLTVSLVKVVDWRRPGPGLKIALYTLLLAPRSSNVFTRTSRLSYDLRSCDAQLLTESVTRRHARLRCADVLHIVDPFSGANGARACLIVLSSRGSRSPPATAARRRASRRGRTCARSASQRGTATSTTARGASPSRARRGGRHP